MTERAITVSNKLGLHARAAAKLVQLAAEFDSEVSLVRDGRAVNAKSIMGVMMLAAAIGTPLTLRCEGSDAELAAERINGLFDDKFGEGE